MTRQLFSSFAKLAGLSALLGSALLMAETGPQATAEIPFDFTVHNQVLPAGAYWIEDLHDVLKIKNVSSKKTMVVLVQSAETPRTAQPKVVFHRYGNSYFLSEVVSSYGGRSVSIGKSRAEKKMTASKHAPAPVLASIRLN